MTICFLLNDLDTEKCGTSVTLMRCAVELGHEVFVMDVGDFFFSSEEPIHLHTRAIPRDIKVDDLEKFWATVKTQAEPRTISAANLDVLFVRNNPTEESRERRWAEQPGIAFGRMIQRQGVIVLNDAYAMSNAFIDKLYFEELPQEIKPRSIVSRKKEDIIEFYQRMGDKMVVKPLEGSGGQGVFLVNEDEPNLNQILDTLQADGYIIAQEFLPAAGDGDIRVILMNGRVLELDGKQALIRRKSSEGEFRNNISTGGSVSVAEMTPEIEHIVNVTAPMLIRDGHFLVGLDVVDDKLIEINVLSPGGLETCEAVGLPDFSPAVIEAIDRKVEAKKRTPTIPNHELASME